MSLSDLTFHSCFGRFAGETLEYINFLSDEWTQVRNKKHQDKKKQGKEISKMLGNWTTFQNAKDIVRLEVTPKEHKSSHSLQQKASVKKPIL
jgi:hypothetical protein